MYSTLRKINKNNLLLSSCCQMSIFQNMGLFCIEKGTQAEHLPSYCIASCSACLDSSCLRWRNLYLIPRKYFYHGETFSSGKLLKQEIDFNLPLHPLIFKLLFLAVISEPWQKLKFVLDLKHLHREEHGNSLTILLPAPILPAKLYILSSSLK